MLAPPSPLPCPPPPRTVPLSLATQHLTLKQLHGLLHDAEAVHTVRAFLAQFPVLSTRATVNEEFITVTVTVQTAQAMLGAEFSQFAHAASGTTLHRVDTYSLPAAVAAAVDFVGHTTHLPTMRVPMFLAHSLGAAAGNSTPQVISAYYGIANNTVSNKKASNCVFETIGQSYAPADLQLYDTTFNVPLETEVTVIGPNDPASCSDPNNCVEAELDIQVITAIAQQGDTTFWSIPGDESFLQWIDAVASDPTPPLVHSISYGEPEEQTDPAQDSRFDTEVAKMGVRGLTIIIASGDDGVAGSNARSDPTQCGFHPSYPATAAHVTAVGATQGPESDAPEVACSSATGGVITTGGGFSTVFPQPSYQAAAVAAYLANPSVKLPPTNLFASTGRAYPDVGVMGHRCVWAPARGALSWALSVTPRVAARAPSFRAPAPGHTTCC
jgi:tripeptidyl-peptidase-1